MKLPRGDVLIWGVIMLAGGLYTLIRLPSAQPELVIVSAVVGAFMLLIAALLWARFRWAPELFALLLLFFIGWGTIKSAIDEVSRSRTGLSIGGALGLFAYPSLRRGVRSTNSSDGSGVPSHWAAVAGAAYYARLVQPIFDRCPIPIDAARRDGLNAALNLVEQSAANATPAQGLDEAIVNVVMARGAVGRAAEARKETGSLPPDEETAAAIAIKVTFAVEHAVEAARGKPPLALSLFVRAYLASREACEMAGELERRAKVDAGFHRTLQLNAECGWTDDRPVPQSAFSMP